MWAGAANLGLVRLQGGMSMGVVFELIFTIYMENKTLDQTQFFFHLFS
jgi:hypothetical protein